MSALEALALARLRQWRASRLLLLNGRGHPPISREGWKERRARDNDAHNTRAIDFEIAFDRLPAAYQILLVLVYADQEPISHAAEILKVSPRAALAALHPARAALADVLDRRHLL